MFVRTATFSIHYLQYEGVSKSFRTGRLERELQMVQLSASRCSCMAILWVSLVSFAAITLCVVSQLVFSVIVFHFVIDSGRQLFDTPSYTRARKHARTYIHTYIHTYIYMNNMIRKWPLTSRSSITINRNLKLDISRFANDQITVAN
jgi:hypothetical protein